MSFLYGTNIRIALAGFGFLGAVFAVPWAVLACMALLALRFRAWEVPLMGIWMDFLWLPSESLVSPIPLFTLVSIIIVWGLEPLRNELLAR